MFIALLELLGCCSWLDLGRTCILLGSSTLYILEK